MKARLAVYGALEAALGRNNLWKAGRFLYQGARRELLNDPEYNGEYALLRWLRPHWHQSADCLRFYDVGANFADWSVRLLSRLGPEAARAQLVAFEPAPAQADRAERALSEAANGAVVKLERMAVAATPGEIRFDVTGTETGNSSIAVRGDRSRGVMIACTTLDQYAGPADGTIHMVKVDTEGNDCNVIEGAQRLLAQGRIEVLQFEYNHRWLDFRRTLRDVYDLLEGTDYSIGLLTQRAVEFHSRWHFELERFFEANFVIVRNDIAGCLPKRQMHFGRSNSPHRS